MARPLVSVVIPSYNSARYIVEAIESLLKQTHDNLEIIVVDDGSTDQTRETLERYVTNNIVKYIYQENQGPGGARNTGIKAATGEYIAFLDADDTLTESSIEKRLNFMEYSPTIGLVFSTCFFEKEQSKVEKQNCDEILRNHSQVRNVHGVLFTGTFKDIFDIPFNIATATVVIVRKSVFEKAGYFRTDIMTTEDKDMWLRIAAHYQLGFINEPLAYYKRFRGVLTVRDPLKYCYQRITFLRVLLNEHGHEKTLRTFLCKKLGDVYHDMAVYFYTENKKAHYITNRARSICYKYIPQLIV